MDEAVRSDLMEYTVQIVSSYLSNNVLAADELPNLIASTHQALSRLGDEAVAAVREDLKPAISIKRSVTPDYIVCLEDGKKFKSLKRHLRTHYNLSPEQYREKWGLPHDYPMVAPSYAAARSDLAKKMGLGTSKRDK